MVRFMIASVVLLLSAAPAAGSQIFWELEGATQGPIEGNATFFGEENRIIVSSMNFGFSSSINPGSGQTGSPRIDATSISLTKRWDPSSVNLAAALSNQEPLSRCIIRVYPAGGSAAALDSGPLERRMPQPYELKLELINARLEFVSISGDTNETSEAVGIVFEEIRIEHGPTLDQLVWSRRVSPRAARPASPNLTVPVRPTASPLEFALPAEGDVTIEVTDADGYTVRSLVSGDASNYEGRVTWDATDDAGLPVAPGIYVATVHEAGVETTHRIVIGQ